MRGPGRTGPPPSPARRPGQRRQAQSCSDRTPVPPARHRRPAARSVSRTPRSLACGVRATFAGTAGIRHRKCVARGRSGGDHGCRRGRADAAWRDVSAAAISDGGVRTRLGARCVAGFNGRRVFHPSAGREWLAGLELPVEQAMGYRDVCPRSQLPARARAPGSSTAGSCQPTPRRAAIEAERSGAGPRGCMPRARWANPIAPTRAASWSALAPTVTMPAAAKCSSVSASDPIGPRGRFQRDHVIRRQALREPLRLRVATRRWSARPRRATSGSTWASRCA